MDERGWLAEQFEENRGHLRAVAYRMLGSLNEADDAVQEAWLRLNRSDANEIGNLGGWLTTVVARVCLDILRSRTSRREESLDTAGFAEQAAVPAHRGVDPEQEALLADSVGLALLVVLDRLNPAERLAFVLHDLFDLSFDEIASILDRSPEAARQLASRARRRVRGTPVPPHAQPARQRELVSSFLAALRSGDVEALLAVLDPDLVVQADATAAVGGTQREVRGARSWAAEAIRAARGARFAHPALVDGIVGLVVAPKGRLFRVLRFSFSGNKIAAIEVVGDSERLRAMEITVLDAV
jgi:RNA polymerase sigma factor (sigma-70 family)